MNTNAAFNTQASLTKPVLRINNVASAPTRAQWTKAGCSDWLEMWAPKLTPAQFKVAYIISRHADSETGEARVSVETIGAMIGMAKGYVKEVLDGFPERCIHVTPGKQGRNNCAVYRLLAEAGEVQAHKDRLRETRAAKREAHAAYVPPERPRARYGGGSETSAEADARRELDRQRREQSERARAARAADDDDGGIPESNPEPSAEPAIRRASQMSEQDLIMYGRNVTGFGTDAQIKMLLANGHSRAEVADLINRAMEKRQPAKFLAAVIRGEPNPDSFGNGNAII